MSWPSDRRLGTALRCRGACLGLLPRCTLGSRSENTPFMCCVIFTAALASHQMAIFAMLKEIKHSRVASSPLLPCSRCLLDQTGTAWPPRAPPSAAFAPASGMGWGGVGWGRPPSRLALVCMQCSTARLAQRSAPHPHRASAAVLGGGKQAIHDNRSLQGPSSAAHQLVVLYHLQKNNQAAAAEDSVRLKRGEAVAASKLRGK